jgi:hypothetical protein
MFMHYLDCGIRHKIVVHILQARGRPPTKTEDEVQKDLIIDDVWNLGAEPHLDKYVANKDGDDGSGAGDIEDVNTDEEVDFGYRDSKDSKGKESNNEDVLDGEDDCIYEL